MNKETLKAIKKNNQPSKLEPLKNWWEKYNYIVFRIIFFPVWIITLGYYKIIDYLNSRTQWDEKRADKILSYYIPRRSDWNEEDKTFYFFDNGYGWMIGSAKKFLKLKDRRFWQNNAYVWGGLIRNYLITTFELEGFTKKVIDEQEYTEIIFEMIREDK